MAETVIDSLVALSAIIPKGAIFAAIAVPVKEFLFAQPDMNDLSQQLEQIGQDIQNKVESEHINTRREIVKQADQQKMHMDNKFNEIEKQIDSSNSALYRKIIELILVKTTGWPDWQHSCGLKSYFIPPQ